MIRRFRSWLRKEVNNMAVIYVALIDLELAELVTE